MLVHYGFGSAGLRVHRDDAQDLMPSLIVEKCEMPGIGTATHVVDGPRIGKEHVTYRYFLLRIDAKEMRLADGDLVAGLKVRVGIELWLKLVFG